MGIPAQLSSVPAQTPYVQYVASAGQTVFPYNFEITQDSDLVVVYNGVTWNTDSGYTVSGVGNSTGGNMTLNTGASAGDIVTLYRDIPISRLTQIAQNSGFSSAVFNNEFNNIYLLLQQLQSDINQCLQIPNTNNPAPTTTLIPATWAGKYMSFDSNGNPTPAALTSSGSITGAILGGILKSYSGAITASDVRSYGVVGDGATDDTAAFQSAVDANKGGLVYVPYGITPLIGNSSSSVKLVGSSYNGTTIRVDGELILGASPSAGTTNYQSGWVGLAFENCDRCSFEGKWNGNRANQPQDESIFCVALSGATNFRMPSAAFREIRGDGVYINQVAWDTDSSPACQNVSIGTISGYNSADDGRNLVSVICCEGLTIGALLSDGIGGTVNSVNEPGGFDVEPNHGYQACTDIAIGSASITTAGNHGFSLVGQAITDDATRDWNIQRVSVGALSVTNSVTGRGVAPLLVQRARDVTIRGLASAGSSGSSMALNFDYADHVTADVVITGTPDYGAWIGPSDYLYDSDVRLNIRGYVTNGLRTTGVGRTRFSGRVTGATTSSGTYAIEQVHNSRTVTQTDVVYSVDCPYDGSNVRGFENDGSVTIGTGTCIKDCSYTDYASFGGQTNCEIPSFNVLGRNIANGLTAAPGTGTWAAGDEVTLDQTAVGSAPRAKCITAGSAGTWELYLNPVTVSTGWGTPTGASVENDYAGGSATLGQTSAAVAEIIVALESAGILGS